ncbi:hypothetical protein J6590_076867 [Homalodisca vitripennis]|nr:hypothetical protein J6590_076867 [Homalodisca vitripennis]
MFLRGRQKDQRGKKVHSCTDSYMSRMEVKPQVLDFFETVLRVGHGFRSFNFEIRNLLGSRTRKRLDWAGTIRAGKIGPQALSNVSEWL